MKAKCLQDTLNEWGRNSSQTGPIKLFQIFAFIIFATISLSNFLSLVVSDRVESSRKKTGCINRRWMTSIARGVANLPSDRDSPEHR